MACKAFAGECVDCELASCIYDKKEPDRHSGFGYRVRFSKPPINDAVTIPPLHELMYKATPLVGVHYVNGHYLKSGA